MTEFLFQILKASALSVVFYLAYKAFLGKLSFIRLNRIVLNCIMPLSLAIVFFPVEITEQIENKPKVFNDLETTISSVASTPEVQAEQSFQLGLTLLFSIYLIGLFISLIKPVLSIQSIMALTKKLKAEHSGKLKIYESGSIKSPFSFFNQVFIPYGLAKTDKDIIILHESEHFNQKHAYDILSHQVWKSILWFNPIVYLLEKLLKTNHEYLVDRKLITSEISILEYLQSLENVLITQKQLKTAHYFKSKNLKNRITMMTQPKTKSVKLVLYLSLLGILVLSIYAFSTTSDGNVPSIKPVDNARIGSGFGYRTHVILDIKKMHSGVDFIAPTGTPVKGTAIGVVTEVDTSKGYGIHIKLSHGKTYETHYSHLSEVLVSKGDKVKLGEEIAKVGNTGLSSAPHLHYEVIENGLKVNPAKFFSERENEDE